MTRRNAMPHVLVVDDDRRLRQLLVKYLESQDWAVTEAADASEAERLMRLFAFDAAVVDIMMPGESGVDFTRRLQGAAQATPVLLLTALGEAEHRVGGLESGAEDYLTKPFEPKELLLRLQRLTRRSGNAAPPPMQLGRLRLELGSGRLWQGEDAVELTAAEREMLRALAQAKGQTVSREALAVAAGLNPGNPRTVDVQVTRLRKKIEPEPETPRYLLTVRNAGYALRGAG